MQYIACTDETTKLQFFATYTNVNICSNMHKNQYSVRKVVPKMTETMCRDGNIEDGAYKRITKSNPILASSSHVV